MVTGTNNINNVLVKSSLFTLSKGTGDAGNLTINTSNLTIVDGGDINVSATGQGKAGSLEISTDNIQLNNGAITAATRSTKRGNITLNITENLELRNDAEITATAGTAEAGGNGENVTINSDFIFAFPTPNNHEITAKAFAGDGGKINITTNSILGRESIEIDASSNFGLDSTIAIETPDVDPTSDVMELTDVPVDAEATLAQDLCRLEDGTIAKGSSFIITGRGDLTPTAEDSLSNVNNVVGWVNRDDLDVSNDGTVEVR